MIALQHGLAILGIKVPQSVPRKGATKQHRFQVTHSTLYQMEMVDTFEGGKITIFTHYLQQNTESPFRVILDPPIGNFNQVMAT